MDLAKSVSEKQETIKRSVTYTAEFGSWDVYVTQREGESWEISVCYRPPGLRLSLLRFYPKRVGDLELLANELPQLLRETAEAMRREGLDDLRSRWDVTEDEMQKRFGGLDAIQSGLDATQKGLADLSPGLDAWRGDQGR